MGDNTLVDIVTPVGELHYVHITGKGKRNFNDDGDEYTATLHLSGERAEILKTKIDSVRANPPKGFELKGKGYKELLVDADGKLYSPDKNGKVWSKDEAGDKEDITKDCKPSGVFAFTFKTNILFPNGKTKEIGVFNCAKPPQKVKLGERRIGNKTLGAISGKMQMFTRDKSKEYGISLFLSNIQITKYIPYEGNAGFESHEDGEFNGDFEDGGSFESAPAEEEVKEEKKSTSKPKL